MIFGRQTTVRDRVVIQGRGVHSNAPVNLVINPSEADTGIVFQRSGLPDGRERLITADWRNVSMTELCTVIGDQATGAVATIEHLLAALAGLGVDNALIEIDGPEAPIMDGSAAAFVAAIDQVGVAALAVRRRYIRVLKPVRVETGRAFSELRPAREGFRLEVEIDFPTALIGRQKFAMELEPERFRREIARARTFGFVSQVEELWKRGFALGSSLENSVALDNDRILNPEGLRYDDEFVRHKMLDAVGDLALAGAPLIGVYRSYCGGHKSNHAVLKALFADRDAYEMIELPTRRRSAGTRADASLGLSAAAFAPDRG
ncbi:MAG: UDP-3-O-acyl-N-acetylglucosamine deacetylase [Methylobacteriaceae bacterium]|nr:UDP-3-O-acyl-N-acetylglucosamine deacetylase [Methylobacteriaceae bacterium]